MDLAWTFFKIVCGCGVLAASTAQAGPLSRKTCYAAALTVPCHGHMAMHTVLAAATSTAFAGRASAALPTFWLKSALGWHERDEMAWGLTARSPTNSVARCLHGCFSFASSTRVGVSVWSAPPCAPASDLEAVGSLGTKEVNKKCFTHHAGAGAGQVKLLGLFQPRHLWRSLPANSGNSP